MKGYLSLFRESPDFRNLYAARTVSQLGDWLNLFALFSLVRGISPSTTQAFGFLLVLKLLPIFLAGPLAGVINDRFSRKRVMIVSDLLRFVVVCGYFLVPFAGSGGLPLLYVLLFFQTTFAAFFEPGFSALLPQILEPKQLTRANALQAMTWSAIYALGAALGGLLNHWLGWQAAIVIDAGTYLWSAWFVARLPTMAAAETSHGPMNWKRLTGFGDLADGVRYVRGNFLLFYLLLLKTGWCVAGGVQLLLAVFGEQVYHFGNRPDLGTAVLYTVRAIGTGFGPIIGRRLSQEKPREMLKIVLVSFFLSSSCYFLFSVWENIWWAIAMVFLSHLGGSAIWVFSTVLLQQNVENRFRGRVFAAEIGLATLMISISTLVLGTLLEEEWLSLWRAPQFLAVILLCVGSSFVWVAWKKHLLQRLSPEAE